MGASHGTHTARHGYFFSNTTRNPTSYRLYSCSPLDRYAERQGSLVVIQALHHASVHGEQVCKGLEGLGVEAPDLQPWAYADATGRSRWLRPES